MNKNIYWEAFMQASDKNEFVLKFANDLIKLFGEDNYDGNGFVYPQLIDTVKYNEDEYEIVLDHGKKLGYEDLLLCFQQIASGPIMLLQEESMDNFFDLVFNKDFNAFIGLEYNKICSIEHEGIKAKYYNERREDGIIFSGVLFD